MLVVDKRSFERVVENCVGTDIVAVVVEGRSGRHLGDEFISHLHGIGFFWHVGKGDEGNS